MHAHIIFKRSSSSQLKSLELNGARAYIYIYTESKLDYGLAFDDSLRELLIKEQNNREEKTYTKDVIIVPFAWLVVGQLIFKSNRSILEKTK